MSLSLEKLEPRRLLAVPQAPFDFDLLAAGDSGVNSDDITNLTNGVVEFIAEKGSTTYVYNGNGCLGNGVGQGDTLFYDPGDIVVEAEEGTVAGNMVVEAIQGGFVDTGYVRETAATGGDPSPGGTTTISFYVVTEDDYNVYARVYYPDGNGNSFFLNIDDTWDVGETGPGAWSNTLNSWHLNKVQTVVNGGVDMSWHLTVGWHTLEVHGRETDALLDRFIITANPAVPNELAAETLKYETFQYTLSAGDMSGSAAGTVNSLKATAENLDGVGPASTGFGITYDTATTTPGAPDLAAASDTGSDPTDDITNDTTPTFTGPAGSVEGSATVWVRVGGIDKKSTTANADGSYSITMDVGNLAEGANAVDVYYVDVAGNTSAAGADLTVTLDTLAAAPAAPDLTAGSDTGTANNDDQTNDTTATFTGGAASVPNNATVVIRVGGIDKQSTTAAGDGSYSITLAPGDLAEGANAVDIYYVDTAGNSSADSANLAVTLDTVSAQPAAPDLTGTVAHDTGVAQNDDITNNANCQITGTAEANGTVHIWVNGTEVNTAAVDGLGDWSYSFLGGDLGEGANAVTVTVEDAYSNPQSVHSSPLVITLNRTLATPAAPDLLPADDSGSSNSDDVTGDTTPQFDGYAEPGATVQLFVGVVGKGTDTADASTGAWSVELAGGDLAGGANDVTVVATDAAGNTATSPILVVTYDAGGTQPNAPLLLSTDDSGSSNADNITNITAPTVYGSVAGGNTVESGATVHVRTNKNGGGWNEVGTTVADSNGAWSYTFDGVDDLAEGTNDVDIYITDLSNNDSTDSNNLTITLDTTNAAPVAAPDLDPASDSNINNDDITSDTTPTFTGPAASVPANATVYVRVDGSNVRSTTAAGDGSYSITLLVGDLPAGAHLVDIVTVDPAGNTSGDSPNLTVTLDTSVAAPVLACDLDTASDTGTSDADNLTNDTTPTFTAPAGSVEGNATVWVRVDTADQKSTTANADGSFSITMDVGDLTANAANAVDYYYIDPAGNTSADSPDLTVTLDTVVAAPVLPDLTDASDTGLNNTDNVTAETRPTIAGPNGAVENNSTVQVWLDTPSAADTQVASISADVNGAWTYTFPSSYPLEEGANAIRIVAVDPAGNISVSSPVLNVTVDFDTGAEDAPDLTAASDTGASNADNVTADTTPTITGACPNGAQIRLRINNTTIISFTDNDGNDGNGAAGQWSYTLAPATLAEGANTIDFLTIDTALNTTEFSRDLIVTLDTTVEQPSVPDLITTHDSGANSADDRTNVTAPTLSGTAEPGSTVIIDVNAATNTTTATAAANGIWTKTLTNGWLNEGANTIFVQAVDPAGNTSAASANLVITLDTTIGVPTTPDLTPATDTGASNSDDITSHANPRITGTADANTTITVRLDPNGANTLIGTTVADGAGNYSYTFAPTDLAEGANDIDVLATDDAGNTADSNELTITVETAISTPSGLDLSAASDLGDANNDDLTSLAAATITGAADAACTVNVRVNGTEVGSAIANGGGVWTYTFDGVDDLIEGINLIDAYAVDGVGNVSAYSADLVVTLDTTVAVPTAPDLTLATDSGTIDTDNYTNDATAEITGYCEVGATVLVHLNGLDGFDTVTDAADGSTDGVWSYTFAGGLLATDDGTDNTIKTAQSDPAGNTSAYGAALTVTLDDAAQTPTLPDLVAETDTGDANNDDITNDPHIRITGAVEGGSSLQIFIDQGGGPALIDTISEHLISTSVWTYTLSTGHLAEGNNALTVIATDKAGNISAASPALNVTFDTTISQPSAPDLAAASDTGDLPNDDITSDDTPTFSGTADPNNHITIRVDGEDINTVDADGAGNWSYTFTLGQIQTGVRRVDVIATDIAGNVSVPSDDLTVWLNVQPTQPAAPNLRNVDDSGSIQSDNITNVTEPTIDGKADADSTVSVYVDNNLVGTAVADADGFWNYQFAAGVLIEEDNVVTIITEDTSGLRSASSFPLTIDLDTIAPDAPLPDLQPGSDTGASNTDDRTADRTATIEGITEPAATVDVYLADTQIASLTATLTGEWTYTFLPDALADGDNLVHVIITDVAGNPSAASETLTLVLDAQQQSPDTPELHPESDSGAADDDGLTNDPTGAIQGVVKPDSSVEIIVSGATVANVQADDAGVWDYTFTDGQLAEGRNHVEVISTDPAGNIARSAALNLTLDTTAPIIYNHFPAGAYTHTTGTVEIYVSGGDIDNLAAADTSGYILTGAGGDGTFNDGNEWTIPITGVSVDSLSGLVQLNTAVTLTDDLYQVTILPELSLRDLAGNPAQFDVATATTPPPLNDTPEAVTLTFTFEIDTAGPEPPAQPALDAASDSGMSNTDNITNTTTPLIHVTAAPEIAVEIICNGRSAGFANEVLPGQYRLYIDNSLLREGENLLLARAFDSLSNSSPLSELLVFTYDTEAPQVAAIVADELWINTGPRTVSIVFTDNAIDETTIDNLSGYQILAAGGDGTFNDGNEILIPATAAAYTSEANTILLTLPQTATGASQLGPDHYRLSVLPAAGIADLAGNVIDQTTTIEFVVVEATTVTSGQSYSFTTAAGSGSVRLIGPGQAQVLLGEEIGTSNGIEQITVSGTETSSFLWINSSGDLTLGRLLAESPLRMVFANSITLVDRADFDEPVSQLSLGSIAANVEIDIDAGDTGLQLRSGSIADGIDLAVEGRLSSLFASSVGTGRISADVIDTIFVTAGNLAADVEATAGDIGRIFALGGDLTGTVTAAGDVGTIYARNLIGASVSAARVRLISARDAVNSRLNATDALGHLNLSGDFLNSEVSSASPVTAVNIRGDATDAAFLTGTTPTANVLPSVLPGTADIGYFNIAGRTQNVLSTTIDQLLV